MPQCKNCQKESDSKFCPECGFRMDGTKTKGDEAFETLKSIDSRLKKLEEDNEARSKKREEREKEREKRRDSRKPERKGILDIF